MFCKKNGLSCMLCSLYTIFISYDTGNTIFTLRAHTIYNPTNVKLVIFIHLKRFFSLYIIYLGQVTKPFFFLNLVVGSKESCIPKAAKVVWKCNNSFYCGVKILAWWLGQNVDRHRKDRQLDK